MLHIRKRAEAGVGANRREEKLSVRLSCRGGRGLNRVTV